MTSGHSGTLANAAPLGFDLTDDQREVLDHADRFARETLAPLDTKEREMLMSLLNKLR